MYKIYDAIRTIINALGNLFMHILMYLSAIISLFSALLLTYLTFDQLILHQTEFLDRLTMLFYITIGSFVAFYMSKKIIDMDNKK